MTTKKTNKRKNDLRLLACALLIALPLILAGYLFKYYYLDRYEQAWMASGMVSVREMILNGTQSTKLPAPVDAKTGDIYFPEAKLYLPNEGVNLDTLNYGFDQFDNYENILTISNKMAYTRAANRLYSAMTLDEMFNYIPELQACTRGAKLAYRQLTLDGSIKYEGSVKLKNGKTLNIYSETGCTEQFDLINRLKNIKSY